jgi:hypothetical protein
VRVWILGITTKRLPSGSGFDVVPAIRRIPNQFTVLLDPEAREADFSDQNICFVTDIYRKSLFPKRFRKATKTSFTTEDQKMAPDWFRGEDIVVAEAWRRALVSTRKRLKVKGPGGDTLVYQDELRDGDNAEVLDERDENTYKVIQYITNGIEIIDKVDWAGSWIPIIPMLGEEVYEPDAEGQSKRIFMSLTRRMKTPQKMVAFLASQEAEEFGMAPRVPIVLYAGQELADKKAWENLHKEPRSYIRINPVRDEVSGQILPFPGRHPFTPNIDAYQVAIEAWVRAAQASAGIAPLPTSAQRQNEKSGIALERIENAEATGAYHFTDNADRSLENGGRQLNELITNVMDTPRLVPIRQGDEKHTTMMVGGGQHEQLIREHLMKLQGDKPMPEGGLDYLISDRGEFDVTIATGPDKASEREEQSDFVDTLIKEAPGMGLPPQILNKLVAIAVKMKDLGHFGDEIAKLLDPEDQNTQALQQAQMQLQQFQEQAAKLAQEVEQLKIERAGKVIDNEYKLQMTQLQNDIKVLVAEIGAKSQSQSERLEMFMQFWKENHGASHEIAMQKDQQAHEHSIADKQAAIAAATQVSDQTHEQTMAQSQPEGTT